MSRASRYFFPAALLLLLMVLASAAELRAQQHSASVSENVLCAGSSSAENSGAAQGRFVAPKPGRIAAAQLDTVDIVPGLITTLEPNAPNPCGAFTTIGYTIVQDGPVTLTLYDFYYNPVLILVDENQVARRYEVRFSFPPDLSSGMYFYELKADGKVLQRRLLHVK